MGKEKEFARALKQIEEGVSLRDSSKANVAYPSPHYTAVPTTVCKQMNLNAKWNTGKKRKELKCQVEYSKTKS